MNLNEECLLQYLQRGLACQEEALDNTAYGNTLKADMNRVLRRDRYVTFPVGILVRRSAED